MTVYWDAGALVRIIVGRRHTEIMGVTRTHTLAEVFSALTGRGWKLTLPSGHEMHRRMGPVLAAKQIQDLRRRLVFIDLTPDEVELAVSKAKELAVQGRRVHDLLHMAAAEKAMADEFWTTDRNDLTGLGSVPLKFF